MDRQAHIFANIATQPLAEAAHALAQLVLRQWRPAVRAERILGVVGTNTSEPASALQGSATRHEGGGDSAGEDSNDFDLHDLGNWD